MFLSGLAEYTKKEEPVHRGVVTLIKVAAQNGFMNSRQFMFAFSLYFPLGPPINLFAPGIRSRPHQAASDRIIQMH